MEDAAPEAESEAEPIPMLTFTISVGEGKNLSQLVPKPVPADDAPEAELEGWVPKIVVVVTPPDSEPSKSETIAFEGDDCAFDFTTSFERGHEDSLFNCLCTSPMELQLLDGAECEDGAEPAVLGTMVVNFDALLDGELEYSSWYHVAPTTTGDFTTHPEVNVTIKVSELMQTPLMAQECTTLSLEVDKAFMLPEACLIVEGSESPSPADTFQFGFKLALPVTAEEEADLVFLGGIVS